MGWEIDVASVARARLPVFRFGVAARTSVGCGCMHFGSVRLPVKLVSLR